MVLSFASAQPAQVGVPVVLGDDANARVDGHDSVWAGDDRVEVEFGDVGVVLGEAGDPQQRVLQARDIDGRTAAVAEQERRAVDRADELGGSAAARSASSADRTMRQSASGSR
jgi:hypothetical protein